jgi:hypothetical protein
MKFALTINVPEGLAQRIHDFPISEAHKIHDLINLKPEKRLDFVQYLVLQAVQYAMARASTSTTVNTEKLCVQRVFSLTIDVARQFAISTQMEMDRVSPTELRLLSTNVVSHQDILRTIATLTYEAISGEELSLSKVGF